MVADKLISIIMPSFRDPRMLDAIASVRAFDDIGAVRIVVIDGGSDAALVEATRASLSQDDVLVSEKDEGIFDALNKGLDRVRTPYIGWLGADDLFTGDVKASEIVTALSTSDLFIASLIHFKDDLIRRKSHSWPAAHGLVKYGFNNPHYSTFGRAELLKSERFDANDIAADVVYFLRIFARNPKVSYTGKTALLMAEGGYSNSSWRKILQNNRHLLGHYARYTNRSVALLSIAGKLSYKGLAVAYYKVRRRRWRRRYPALPGASGAGVATAPAR